MENISKRGKERRKREREGYWARKGRVKAIKKDFQGGIKLHTHYTLECSPAISLTKLYCEPRRNRGKHEIAVPRLK